jgi:hypothetical protein
MRHGDQLYAGYVGRTSPSVSDQSMVSFSAGGIWEE